MIITEESVVVQTNLFVEQETAPRYFGSFVAFESRVNDEKFMQPWPCLIPEGVDREKEIDVLKKEFEDDCIGLYLKHGRFLPGLS